MFCKVLVLENISYSTVHAYLAVYAIFKIELTNIILSLLLLYNSEYSTFKQGWTNSWSQSMVLIMEATWNLHSMSHGIRQLGIMYTSLRMASDHRLWKLWSKIQEKLDMMFVFQNTLLAGFFIAFGWYCGKSTRIDTCLDTAMAGYMELVST